MAIKRKQTNKSKTRNRNKFQGMQVPDAPGSGLNLRGIAMAGIAAHDHNGKFPKRQSLGNPEQQLPPGFRRAFMQALPEFHATVREHAIQLLPEIDPVQLGDIVLLLERLLPNHPDHDTPEGFQSEKMMADLYAAYHRVAPPVETDSDEAAVAYQAAVEQKLGALQFAALREVMGFVQSVRQQLNIPMDPQIEEASEFSSELEQVTDEQMAAVMAEQRPEFDASANDAEADKKLEEVLGLPPEALVEPKA